MSDINKMREDLETDRAFTRRYRELCLEYEAACKAVPEFTFLGSLAGFATSFGMSAMPPEIVRARKVRDAVSDRLNAHIEDGIARGYLEPSARRK